MSRFVFFFRKKSLQMLYSHSCTSEGCVRVANTDERWETKSKAFHLMNEIHFPREKFLREVRAMEKLSMKLLFFALNIRF